MTKLPKGFHEYEGLCSQHRPQALCREADRCQVEVYRRNGELTVETLYEIDWTATRLPTDIIAWRLS
jgi:hypothetical protein